MPPKPFWHIHHEVLLEWSDDIQERIDYIKAHKPPHEVETRLRLLKPVQGALPPKLVKAGDARDKAKAAYDKAWDAFGKDWDAYVKARAAFGKDWDALDKADAAYLAYDKAWDAYDKAYDECLPQIEALHILECPDCPWDGTTIFPE